MKTLQRYVTSSYLSAFLLALIVLTFVLSVGLLVKATQLVVRGLPLRLVFDFLMAGVPESFAFTIPLAALVSALLVFGRLSADGEISAMKACGVNLWRIMYTPMLAGLLMTTLGIYINNEVSPRSHQIRRQLSTSLGIGVGLQLLEPGRFIQDFPNMTFWFASRDGNWLTDVLIFDKSRSGSNREIRAERARIETRGNDLLLDLHQVRVDPFSDEHPVAASADRLTHVIPDALKPRAYRRRMEDYDLGELLGTILSQRAAVVDGAAELVAAARVDYARMLFELNRRFALASAAFCFLLLGMPLGIRAQRRESTVGVAISLVVAMLYYVFVVAGDSFLKRAGGPSCVVLWIPAVICLVLASWLIIRNR